MLKENVKYEDYDENEVEEVLWFNLNKLDAIEHAEELTRRWTDIKNMLEGVKRDLEISEIKELLGVVKYMMEISYGIRDGAHFIKDAETWTKFTQTAAYEAFLLSLFEDPRKAVSFITGIFPKELRAEAQKVIDDSPTLFDNENSDATSATPVAEDTRPLWEREGRKPRPKELEAMSEAELQYAYSKRVSQ